MSRPVFVFVVEQGAYSNLSVVGVYSSSAAAKAAFPSKAKLGWRPVAGCEPDACWWNGCSLEESVSISRFELDR